jgi:hypothetical protein
MENNTDTTQQSASPVQPVQEQNSGADVHGHTNGQSKKIGHYIGAAFGIIFILVFFLPNSVYAQMLAFPIMALNCGFKKKQSDHKDICYFWELRCGRSNLFCLYVCWDGCDAK